MTPPTPQTLHLISQFVRHARGMLTAIEKWVETQPPQTDEQTKKPATR